MLDLHMKDARAVTPCEVFLVGGCSVRRSAVLSVPVVVHTSYARVSFTPSCLILHEYTLFATGGGSVAVGSTWKRGIGSDRSEACSPTKLPPSRGRETDEESKRSDFRGRGAGFCEMVLSAISTRLSHLALCYRRSSEILRLSSWWTMTISSRLKSDSATLYHMQVHHRQRPSEKKSEHSLERKEDVRVGGERWCSRASSTCNFRQSWRRPCANGRPQAGGRNESEDSCYRSILHAGDGSIVGERTVQTYTFHHGRNLMDVG